MLTLERMKTIGKLALPIGIGQSATLIMALIDLAMVGGLGEDAVAAVGVAGFCSTLVFAFMYGLGPAVQGYVARMRGEGTHDDICVPLNASMLISFVVGAVLTVLCYVSTPFFFSLISSDPKVTAIGVPFLQIMYLGIIAVGMRSGFGGFWAGVERPAVSMTVVLLMCVLNIFLNYVLIYGHFGAPALGATGAAIATVISLYVGAAIFMVITWRGYRKLNFMRLRNGAPMIGRVFKVGMPATMQEFFFSAGYIVYFWIIGIVGTQELAAANVLVRATMILMLLAISVGSASATLVSKSVGEGDVEAAERWGWDCGKLGVIGITLMGLPLVFAPEAVLSVFLTDPETIKMAIVPTQLVGATTGIGSLIYIFAYTLVSLGDGNRVFLVSFSTQWLIFLPGVWLIGAYLGYGLLEIFIVQMVYGFMSTFLITSLWAGGRWKTLAI